MARLADGDRAALEPAFARASPAVHRFCARLLGAADGEDAAQEALVKVFARVHELDPEKDALAWVLGVAAYECRTVRRRRTRTKERSDGDALAAATSPAPSAEEEAIAGELHEAALETLGVLRPSDVEAIQAALEDRRAPHAAFRKRLQRALLRLRAAWSKRYE